MSVELQDSRAWIGVAGRKESSGNQVPVHLVYVIPWADPPIHSSHVNLA